MKRLVRRAAVMGVVAVLAYGVGACNEEGAKDQDQFQDPINQQARPQPDPGARPDPTGTTNPAENSPIAPEVGDPRSAGTGGGGADAPADPGPGTSLSRQDGGVDPGARGMAGSGSLRKEGGPADGGSAPPNPQSQGEMRRGIDAMKKRAPDAGTP